MLWTNDDTNMSQLFHPGILLQQIICFLHITCNVHTERFSYIKVHLLLILSSITVIFKVGNRPPFCEAQLRGLVFYFLFFCYSSENHYIIEILYLQPCLSGQLNRFHSNLKPNKQPINNVILDLMGFVKRNVKKSSMALINSQNINASI